jgi:hypothetical protein
MDEEEKRLKFDELEKVLNKAGWTDWTVIAFNPLAEEYKIFSHFSFDGEAGFELFEHILKEMIKICEERKKFYSISTGGSC